MVSMHNDEFTLRQTMNHRFYEYHHYLDQLPPEVEFHEHEFYEIFFFFSGDVTYTVEGRSYQLRPGDILLTNNRDIHRPEVRPGKPYERFVLWLEHDFFTRLEDLGDDLTACFLDSAAKRYKLIRPDGEVLTQLRRLCGWMVRLQQEHTFGSQTLQYAAVTEFLVYLNRAYFDTPEEIRRDVTENEQVKGETFKPTDRIKLYVVEVKNTPRGPKILVSRTHPELVKRLFEAEVAEVRDGTVEIKSIAREAGSRTKMAVWSNDPNVDPVGACVGLNGARVNAVVQELRGEKIDIINWDENPALLIENALSPAKVISVMADPEEKIANVIVPDYQLSLAIGKEGQNARLAAKLTGYKIDIKSETQAIEAGDLPENYMEQLGITSEEGYTGDYDEEYDDEYYDDYEENYEDSNV